jgi:hypothetical protein
MVMTGFLPTHSIETPMDEGKAQGKAEVMRNLVTEATHYQILWALLQMSPLSASDTEIVNAVLRHPGTSARDLLLAHPEMVRQLAASRRNSALTSINKDKLLKQLERLVTSVHAPRLYDDYGNMLTNLPTAAMVELPQFIDWTRGVIERIFDTIFNGSDDLAKTVHLEAVNFDVPTERPLMATVVTSESDTVYTFKIPWYGRQVIQHDPSAFAMLAMIHIAKDIEES